eukprot:g4760.t1
MRATFCLALCATAAVAKPSLRATAAGAGGAINGYTAEKTKSGAHVVTAHFDAKLSEPPTPAPEIGKAGEDCQMSHWSDFSSCTEKCDCGIKLRTRHVTREPGAGGKVCLHDSEAIECNCDDCLKGNFGTDLLPAASSHGFTPAQYQPDGGFPSSYGEQGACVLDKAEAVVELMPAMFFCPKFNTKEGDPCYMHSIRNVANKLMACCDGREHFVLWKSDTKCGSEIAQMHQYITFLQPLWDTCASEVVNNQVACKAIQTKSVYNKFALILEDGLRAARELYKLGKEEDKTEEAKSFLKSCSKKATSDISWEAIKVMLEQGTGRPVEKSLKEKWASKTEMSACLEKVTKYVQKYKAAVDAVQSAPSTAQTPKVPVNLAAAMADMMGIHNLPTEQMNELASYITAKDGTQYDGLAEDTVCIDVTHQYLKTRHLELRFNLHSTIADVKAKIHRHCGTSPEFQTLILRSCGANVCLMEDDSKKLGFYSVTSGMEVHVKDSNPHSGARGGGYEDVSLVEKYVMSEEDYNKRENTVRRFKRDKLAKEPDWVPPSMVSAAEMKKRMGVPQPEGPPPGPESVEGIAVDARCEVQPGARRGAVRFVGEVAGLRGGGLWVGVRFDEPVGKSDGTVKGERIFACEPGHGAFVRGKNVKVGDFPEVDLMAELEAELEDSDEEDKPETIFQGADGAKEKADGGSESEGEL